MSTINCVEMRFSSCRSKFYGKMQAVLSKFKCHNINSSVGEGTSINSGIGVVLLVPILKRIMLRLSTNREYCC